MQLNYANLRLSLQKSNMTDEQIAKGCIENDAIAQKYLYDKYSRKMMGICLRYAESEEEAQDVVQNAFIKVFEHIKDYKGTGSLEGWIRKIMVNTALTDIRKYKKLKLNVELDSVEFMLPSQGHIYNDYAAKDLLKIIQTLPTGFRTVFNLYAIEGYSHKEIGKMLDISEGTSKSQYSRARAHLQKIIQTDRQEK
jgi:RNA polymerase sigma-70 factor (ECF subfamily)